MNWNKILEPLLWTLCISAIVVVGLSDPITWAFISEHWLVIALWGLSVVVCGAISFCAGYLVGKREGYSTGFKTGLEWK